MSALKEGLYFPHPMNTYRTKLEAQCMAVIEAAFPDIHIINAGDPELNAGFEQYKKERGNSMFYFDEIILPYCRGAVGLPFVDGMFGAGVFKEMLGIYVKGYPVSRIEDKRFVITPVPDFPVGCRVLTIDETRRRIKLPYEEAV